MGLGRNMESVRNLCTIAVILSVDATCGDGCGAGVGVCVYAD